MKFSVRLLLGIFIIFISLLLFKHVVYAQNLQQPQQYAASNTNPGVPKNLHTWTQNVMIEVMSAISCQIAGIDPTNPKGECLGIDVKTGKLGYINKSNSAISLLEQGITMLYKPSNHTGDYINYLSQNFGIAKKTYAQGIGFQGINPLVSLWTIFRNITYLFFVFVFILIGIGIMLRVKIDPRTVMTIQNQIPKIIICLIFITFSFAIAGLFIDLMFISINLIFNLLVNSGNIATMSPLAIQGQNVLQVAVGLPGANPSLNLFDIMNRVALAGKDEINVLLAVKNNSVMDLLNVGDIGAALGNLFSGVGGDWTHFSVVTSIYDLISTYGAIKMASMIPCAGSGVPFIGGLLCAGQSALEFIPVFNGIEFFLREIVPFLIIYIIVLLAVFTTLLRVFFMLLKTYIFILLDIIFAPLWIIAGLVPGGGSSVGFGAWMRDLLANLAVFPAVYMMLLLANIVGQVLNTSTTVAFVPPLIGNPLAPGLLGAITSLGFILLTPEVANLTKQFFKSPKLQLGGVKSGLFAAGGLVSGPGRIGAQFYYASRIPGMEGLVNRFKPGGRTTPQAKP
jgi:hypothetical protein